MKKRLFLVFLAGIVAVAAVSAGAFFVYADEPSPTDGLSYDENDFGTLTLTSAMEVTDEEIVVAASVGGKPVTVIGEYAFMGVTTAAKITIPEGITRIEASAFYGCTGITEMTLPASLTYLGAGAFDGCTSLQTVTFLSDAADVQTGAIPDTVTVVMPKAPAIGAAGFRTVPGKSFDLPVVLEANPGFNYAKLYITYNTSVFTLTGIDVGEDFAAMNFEKSQTMTESPLVLVFAATKNVEASGTLATLHFTVNTDAADTDETIALTVVECVNDTDAPVALAVSDAEMTVKSYISGDITEDGTIGGTDLTHLLQYLAGWKIDLYPDAADVNADGDVTGADATLLMQYLAEWDVTLGVPQPTIE